MSKSEIFTLEKLSRAYKKLDTCIYYFGEVVKQVPEAEQLKTRLISLMDDTAALMRDVRREV